MAADEFIPLPDVFKAIIRQLWLRVRFPALTPISRVGSSRSQVQGTRRDLAFHPECQDNGSASGISGGN